MRNLLRCLVLAVAVITSLASTHAAKAQSPETPMCPGGGWCALSTFDCIKAGDCPWRGEKCLCF